MMNPKLRRISALASLVIILVLLPVIITDPRWHLVMSLMCLNAVATLGLYFIAILGLITFAQAAFLGIGAYTVAIFLLRTEVPFFVAWITGAVIAALLAGLVGMIVLKMKGAYFFLVTLALNEFVAWVFHNWASVTGGFDGLRGIPPPSYLSSPGELYYLSLALLVGTLLYIICIQNSRLGLAMKATAENDLMVQSYGVSPFRIRLVSWVTGCFFAGLAGGVNALIIRSSFPSMYDLSASFSYLTFLVFGGMGSLIGPILGSAILTLISEFLRPIKELLPLVYGLIITIILIFVPGGLVGLFRRDKR